MDGLRRFFEVPIQKLWIPLLASALFSLKFAFGPFDPWPDDAWPAYPFAWLFSFVVVACIAVPIQLAYAHLAPRLGIDDFGTRRALVFHAVVVLTGALFGSALGGALVAPLMPPADYVHVREWTEIPGLFFLGTLVVAPIALRGIHYRDKLEQSRTRALRAERAALAEKVRALQARIQPHFLFNSLNAVAALVAEDPARAERALEKVVALFRYALDVSAEPTVPLADELDALEGYLELERLRFPERLRVSIKVEPGVGRVPIPPLVLQPLVENAVRHGIAAQAEGGRLEIEIARDAGALRVRIEDDGSGPENGTDGGAGVALADLRERLALLYGEAARLSLERGALGGCRVSLCLPDRGPLLA